MPGVERSAILIGASRASQREPDTTPRESDMTSVAWHTAPMRIPLHARILLGAALGAVLGGIAAAAFPGHPAVDFVLRYIARPAGQTFLRLLFMLVVPLVFSALVLGIADLGDVRRLGRIGL